MCFCDWSQIFGRNGQRPNSAAENGNDRTQSPIEDDWNRVALDRRALLTRGATATGFALTAPLLFPNEARAQFFKQPSADQQKKVGRDAAAEIVRKSRVLRDSRARDFEEVGRRLLGNLPSDLRRDWDFSFQVLDSKEKNAFALPGGPMFLYSGLYDEFQTEDELAAVTGHEMAHVYKEHWAKQYKKSQTNSLIGIGIGAIVKGKAGQLAGGVVATALSSKFSRSEEDESDKLGLNNLVLARYNPNGMIRLFETLKKAGGGGNKATAFLNSHPLTDDRIKNTRNRIEERGGSFPPEKRLRNG